jgi:hypothetical protein
VKTIVGDARRTLKVLLSELVSPERPAWISPRARIVVERQDEWSVLGEARLGSRPVARLVWRRDGQLVSAQQLDADGRGHGLEIERHAGRTTWCAQWVHGKQHGLAIQLDDRGRALSASRFVHGRGTDIWMSNCGKVSEVRETQDGHLHGWVCWGDPEQPGEEEHYCQGQRHGIFHC